MIYGRVFGPPAGVFFAVPPFLFPFLFLGNITRQITCLLYRRQTLSIFHDFIEVRVYIYTCNVRTGLFCSPHGAVTAATGVAVEAAPASFKRCYCSYPYSQYVSYSKYSYGPKFTKRKYQYVFLGRPLVRDTKTFFSTFTEIARTRELAGWPRSITLIQQPGVLRSRISGSKYIGAFASRALVLVGRGT